MSKSTKDYNKINWSEHFYLDSSSPSGLRWNRDVMVGKYHQVCLFNKGDVAGAIFKNAGGEPTGWRVSVKKIRYLAHRVILVLLKGSIDPKLMVDHIDGNPINNSIINIREVTPAINSRNRKKPVSNKTGVIGVILVCDSRSGNYYTAAWVDLLMRKNTKAFAIKKYGSEEAFRLACDYRTAQIARLNENGANYTHSGTEVLELLL